MHVLHDDVTVAHTLLVADRIAVKQQLGLLVGVFQSADDARQSAFSRTVRADDHADFAGGKVHMVDIEHGCGSVCELQIT